MQRMCTYSCYIEKQRFQVGEDFHHNPDLYSEGGAMFFGTNSGGTTIEEVYL